MAAPVIERIAVLGVGYVGLTTACGLANVGHLVVGYDIDRGKVQRLAASGCPFHEAGLSERLTLNLRAGRLRFTADLADAVADSRLFLICVPTLPRPDGQADVGLVRSVVGQVVQLLAREPGRPRPRPGANEGPTPLIVVKSTVPPGTTDALAREHADTAGGRAAGWATPVAFAVNPEFLKEGTAVDDFERPDRVIIGVADEASEERLRRVYTPFVRNEHPIITVSRTAAEMIKYAANVMLAGRISLINEIANICKLIGLDVNLVRRGVGYDHRIGFEFLYPGIGFGGSCLPKDVDALRTFASERRVPTPFLDAVVNVNRARPGRVTAILDGALGGLRGKTVAVFGLAFKPGTDDLRDSPALALIRALRDAGAVVRGWDPMIRSVDGITVTATPEPALDGADAAVIATAWPELVALDWRAITRPMRNRVVLDGRGALRGVDFPDDVTVLRIGVGRAP
jgi:UDPglucose 6-dehydrogenase